MKITWSVPVPGEALASGRGDLVRATNLIAAVRQAGHDVVVVHAGSRPRTAAAVSAYRTVLRRVLPDPIARVLRDIGRAAHSRAHAASVIAAARAQRADVIIETQVHLSDCGAIAASACGLPLVLDDCSPASEEEALGAGLKVLARNMFSRQVRVAGALTVSSTALKDRLVEEGVPEEKLSVIANGVDLSSYRVTGRDAMRTKLRLGEEPTLVFVGSFQPWHRVDLLVEAVARLTPRPRLLLAGDGPGLAPALARARLLGVSDRITSLGSVPPSHIPEALAACDIGVLPGSNDYGQPMKVLEYAASGLAIVAPDLPPVRALIADSASGLLFPPNDVTALTHALQRLLQDADLRARIGVAARSQIASQAAWCERGRDLASATARVVGRRQEPSE